MPVVHSGFGYQMSAAWCYAHLGDWYGILSPPLSERPLLELPPGCRVTPGDKISRLRSLKEPVTGQFAKPIPIKMPWTIPTYCSRSLAGAAADSDDTVIKVLCCVFEAHASTFAKTLSVIENMIDREDCSDVRLDHDFDL